MFKICEHGQPVGTNCIDCIIDKSPEPKVRVKYHIHDPFGEQEEMAGYLDSPSDVLDLFGDSVAKIVAPAFEKLIPFRFELTIGTRTVRISNLM